MTLKQERQKLLEHQLLKYLPVDAIEKLNDQITQQEQAYKYSLTMAEIKKVLRECSSPQLEDIRDFCDQLMLERDW